MIAIGDVNALYFVPGFLCVAQEPEPNTLTPEERAQGFQLLFDGTTLTAFKVPDAAKQWSIVNGAIKSNSSAGRGRIISKEEFANFVLKAEFRADPNIHSHILLRCCIGARASVGIELPIKD